MRHHFSDQFVRQLEKFPAAVQEKFYKQLRFLIQNLNHPSLHAKKYDEVRNIWQARVDQNIRFYFVIEGDTYVILKVIRHPK